MDFLNVQDQPQLVWPPSFALSRAYADQLERWKGLTPEKVATVRTGLAAAEAMSGGARRDALTGLASQVAGYASGSADPQRVQWLATSIKDLANARR